jgi:hypothetical protein
MNNLKEKIELYELILPPNRQRLEEMKMKKMKIKNIQNQFISFISKWWNNYQIKKLEAWIFYHEELLQNWKNQYHDGFD